METDVTLIDDTQALMQRYVSLPSDAHAYVLATWNIHTWAMDAATVTPYIFISSKEPGSGKTLLLEVLGCMARNAVRADDMTVPIMFKVVHREQVTLLIDEVDALWSGSRNEAKRGFLNTGYKRGGCAWREEARQPVKFSTFGPKVLAGLANGYLPATIYDRSIPISMVRKGSTTRLERFIEQRFSESAELDALIERTVRFARDCHADLKLAMPEPIEGLSDRQNEISEPLLAIAATLGQEDKLREALAEVFTEETGKTAQSPMHQLMRRTREAFGDERVLFTDELCAALGPAFTGRSLAIHLAPLGIAPKDVRRGNQNRKGYMRADFEEAWTNHLPAPDLYAVPDIETAGEVAA